MGILTTMNKDGVIIEWHPGTNAKKYKVIIYSNMKNYYDKKPSKTVQFGAKGYQQYKDQTPLKLYSSGDHLDEKRRHNYRTRHGAQGYQKNIYSPAWFSWHYLW